MGAGHKVERALVGTAIDGVLRYVNKNPEDRQEALLKLVDTVQKIAGNMFQEKSYDAARAMLQDKDCKWVPESGRNVQRYIRLTYLIPELLKLVDEERIAFTPAVELSYLSEYEQQILLESTENRR